MGKSSSRKKKRSKSSSQLRMRKKDKVKSKKSKSKKLRRQLDDSVSYSGDSDSTSMVSVSSSSLEDLYRSRKSRSRNRKDVKGGKKMASRRSSSRESCEDSSYIKKRRGSKNDGTRKRTGKRKKPTRDVSASSRSSRSLSCSTCPSDGDQIGYEKRRGRSQKKEKHGRSEKVKRGSKRSKGGSRSSSCSRYNERSDPSIEEGVVEERTSRRLKSVITVKQENESSRELITDEPKEEDVYDYDDYPSCRSNDSTDGCSRKELRKQPHTVSETKRPPDDDEQVEVSNIGRSNVEETNVSSATGCLNGDDIESILRQRALENLKKFRGELQKNVNPQISLNDVSVCDIKILSSVNTDPFQIKAPKAGDGKLVIATQENEQIRQPPVRRGSSTLPKNDRNTSRTSRDEKYSETVESGVAFPSSRVVPTGIPKIGVNTAINYVSNKPKLIMLQTGVEAPNTCTTGKPAAAAAIVVPPGIPGMQVNTVTDSVSNKPKLVMSRTGLEAPYTRTTQEQAAAAQEPSKAKLVSESSLSEGNLETAGVIKLSKDNAASVSNRPKFVNLRIGQESPNTYTSQKQESVALESCQAKLVTESSVNESSLRTAQTVNPGACVNPGDSICEKPSSSENIISDKQEDDTKDGQFQQKTMSVMRGGEMVQVSYQVYIPKRAPALARRRLKR